MEAILELWLPILLSALVMFVASAIVWMVLPHHKKDWQHFTNEAAVAGALANAPTGQYIIPKEMRTSDWYGTVFLRRSRASMGKNLFQHFLHQLLLAAMTAYIVYHALPPEAEYLLVFRIAGTSLTLGQIGALFSKAIWWSWRWSVVWKEVIDGIVYAALGAGVFGWYFS